MSFFSLPRLLFVICVILENLFYLFSWIPFISVTFPSSHPQQLHLGSCLCVRACVAPAHAWNAEQLQRDRRTNAAVPWRVKVTHEELRTPPRRTITDPYTLLRRPFPPTLPTASELLTAVSTECREKALIPVRGEKSTQSKTIKMLISLPPLCSPVNVSARRACWPITCAGLCGMLYYSRIKRLQISIKYCAPSLLTLTKAALPFAFIVSVN